jgi:kumamolisin
MLAALAAVLIAAGCAASPPPSASNARPARQAIHPSLEVAVRHGRDLGRVPDATIIRLTFGLAERDPKGLDAILDAGGRVTPAAYAKRFGPDAGAVGRLRAVLAGRDVRLSWSPGRTSMDVWMSAGAIRTTFGVRIDRFVGPGGVRFRAPAAPAAAESPAIVPPAWRPLVTSVTGFDDYPILGTGAIRSENGVTPRDMIDFYNVKPLRDAGLDGAGQTIYFLEIDRFGQAGLDAFSQKFGLPTFRPQVVSNPAWGSPAPEGNGPSETDLDLEIAHAMAPGATLVVYYAGNDGRFDLAFRTLLHDHPGSLVSISIGACEAVAGKGLVAQDAAAVRAAAGTGTTIYVSSGDRGAYGCIPNGDNDAVSTNYLSSFPEVTCVGGTTVFLSTTGGYFREAAWGEPAEQWGGGGGVSSLFGVPSWQAGPGIDPNAKGRGEPDVSANADGITGWDVFGSGSEAQVGGTSAAAPFWAGITALIDQDLSKKSLKSVGFANPDLYRFAQSPQGLPSPAFHDVTLGTNLLYPATAGWDYATGLGTPDVGALADDFEWARGG